MKNGSFNFPLVDEFIVNTINYLSIMKCISVLESSIRENQ